MTKPIESQEWYERERAAFIAWWESEGQEKFSATPTLAAGAGWFARAEAASSPSEAEGEAVRLLKHISDLNDLDGSVNREVSETDWARIREFLLSRSRSEEK